jgi:hypothetical protein
MSTFGPRWPPANVDDPAGRFPSGGHRQGGCRLEAPRSSWCPDGTHTRTLDNPFPCRFRPDLRDNARIPCSGRRALSSVVGASERVDRNPRYGSKCRDSYDWAPARSCQVDCRQFASRFSPARATSGHPMIQSQGDALHRSDHPDASPPLVEEQPSSTTMDPSGSQR